MFDLLTGRRSPLSDGCIRRAGLHATTVFGVGRLRADAGVPSAVLDRATRGTPIKESWS